MTQSQLEAHLGFFSAYVDRFMPEAAEDRANIELKRHHSLRVLDEARMITASLRGEAGISGEMEDLVHLAALYHDLGRFPQYRQYGTFNDAASVNHGFWGLRALRESGVIRHLPVRSRKVVQVAVTLHNRRFIPQNMPKDYDVALRVVRDADKLDIMNVMIEYLGSKELSENSVVTLGLRDEPEAYTPALLTQLLAHEQARYSDMQYFNDFRLMLMSWTYDLNYAASRSAVLSRGYFDALEGALPPVPELRAVSAQVRADLAS